MFQLGERWFDETKEGILIFEGALLLGMGINQAYSIGISKRTGNPRMVGSVKLEAFKWQAKNNLQFAKRNAKEIQYLQTLVNRPEEEWVPLYAMIEFYYETFGAMDADSNGKHTIDAVFEAMGLDDKIISDIRFCKRVDPLHPRCTVKIYRLVEVA